MKKILIAIIGLFLFNISAFAFIDYKQSIDISSDATGLRQINFKPDGTIMYVTNREKDTILNILGGVRSSCTYVGAPSLKQLSKCTTFVRVSSQFNDTFSG